MVLRVEPLWPNAQKAIRPQLASLPSLMRLEGRSLDLFGAPAGVGFPHVGRGLNRGDELQGDISDTDESNDGAGNDPEDAVV
jgi:hypothetical protein